MLNLNNRLKGIVSLVVVLVAGGSSFAAALTFQELFTSRLRCDLANTTALWDTIRGELRLPPFTINYVGNYDTTGKATGVAIAGDYAYVANNNSGLQIIDISDWFGVVSIFGMGVAL